MYGSDAPDTFWLNFTNIGLGLVTLMCVLLIVGGVVREILHRARRHAREDDHAFAVRGLGVTMADGGERLDRGEPESPKDR